MIIIIPVIRWLCRDGYVRTVTKGSDMLQFVFEGTLILNDWSLSILERLILEDLRIWTGDKVATVVFSVMIANYGG